MPREAATRTGISDKIPNDKKKSIADQVERACRELLARPKYKRGPFVISDEDIRRHLPEARC